MPPVEDKTFKLKWTMEDYSVFGSEWPDYDVWVESYPIHVDALDCTVWEIHTCPRTDYGYLNCIIQRYEEVEEHGDISMELSTKILGKGGLMLHNILTIVKDLSPKHQVHVNILPTAELLGKKFANDQLVILYEFRQIASDTPDDISSSLWPDELKALSDDMKRLLESGYQSDFTLKSSDGRSIPVHLCVVLARWEKLQNSMRVRSRRPRVIVCPRVNGQTLAAFITYLYTGKIPAADVTIELFDLVVKQLSTERIRFYTFPQEMSIRSVGAKENVVFQWWYTADSTHFLRVLPLRTVVRGEILVDISTVGSYLDVRFSLSVANMCFHLHCTAILVHPRVRFRKSAYHFFNDAYDDCYFPGFIPMSLLSDGTQGIHVVFELSISTPLDWTFVESISSEFQTGSRDVNHVEMLASGLDHFFLENFFNLYDVKLRTADGFFRGCKSVLGIRSEVLRKLFRDESRRRSVQLEMGFAESSTLSSVLAFLYTGWTKFLSVEETLKVYILAVRLSLHGLVRKCEQYLSIEVGRHAS